MPYAQRGIDDLREIIRRCKVLFPSDPEVELLTGEDDVKSGCQAILDEGASIVAVTRGPEGCYILTRDVELTIPAENVDVVDTTGAGDAFAAGFIYGLFKGYALDVCGKMANIAASHCISHPGAREGLPAQGDLKL